MVGAQSLSGANFIFPDNGAFSEQLVRRIEKRNENKKRCLIVLQIISFDFVWNDVFAKVMRRAFLRGILNQRIE